jgi:ribonucleoside-diphosphate reductase alpha chain
MEYMNEYDVDKFVAGCSQSAMTTIEARYLLRNPECPEEVVETIPEMFDRVATALAEVDARYGATPEEVAMTKHKFMNVMVNRRFVPAGRTLINAGSPTSRLVANCVVLHIDDSMEGIFKTQMDAALLQQGGSGVGFPWHTLRPAGEPARTSGSRASGPMSFLRMYNFSFRTIKQQNRHGANMAVMSVDHPDILEFIDFKKKEGDIECFNCSVGITDEFMRQAYDPKYENVPWVCNFNGKEFYTREIERDAKFFVKNITEVKLSAKQIMDRIVYAAWRNGEPGVIFLDTINRTNPLPGLGRIEATNPCGVCFTFLFFLFTNFLLTNRSLSIGTSTS